jgi:hypothetical protein
MNGSAPTVKMFTCLSCQALYQVVKIERGRETVDREVVCLSCGASLPGHEGNFVLKYFMLRKASRKKGWRHNEKPRPSTSRPGL